MGPALTKEPEHKNPIALPDKTIPELNVSENLKLKFEYKNQIAPGSTGTRTECKGTRELGSYETHEYRACLDGGLPGLPRPGKQSWP